MSTQTVVRRPSAGRAFVTFVLGLVVGGALVVVAVAMGLLDQGDTEALPLPAAETPADDAAEAAATTQPATASGDGEVPPSCLAAAEYNATVSTALDGVAVGVRDQDAAAVEEGLDAIADIKPDMDEASAQCRALAGQGSTSTPTP